MQAEVIGIDHVYLSVRSMVASEAFYDAVLMQLLGFRKNAFTLADAPHAQYYNRHFGVVLRPALPSAPAPERGAPGLHHLCLRVATAPEVAQLADDLRARGIDATPARLYPEYAADYCATFFHDPDGVRLEVTNFRAERRERMEQWARGAKAVDLSTQIRPASLDDCGAIAALIAAVVAEDDDQQGAGAAHPDASVAATEAAVRDCIGVAQHHQLLVATDRARVVGYLAVHWIPLPLLSGNEGYVSDLYLAPTHRGRGLGKKLMEAVEQLARERGCLRLMLNNRVASPSFARGFYPQLGFRRRDEFANFIKTLAQPHDAEP